MYWVTLKTGYETRELYYGNSLENAKEIAEYYGLNTVGKIELTNLETGEKIESWLHGTRLLYS